RGWHDRAKVLLDSVAQVNAAIVVVVAEKSQPVLVVQRRPFTAFTERPMALGAIILKNLGSLVVHAERVGHQILVGARLSGRLPVAVVADDAAALVDPEPLVLAEGLAPAATGRQISVSWPYLAKTASLMTAG